MTSETNLFYEEELAEAKAAANALKVTAPVTAQTPPFPDLPAFLKRNPDNTFVDPHTWGPFVPLNPIGPTALEKWQETEQQRREYDRKKTAGRVGKMKAKMHDRAMSKEGKTWNVQTGRWE